MVAGSALSFIFFSTSSQSGCSSSFLRSTPSSVFALFGLVALNSGSSASALKGAVSWARVWEQVPPTPPRKTQRTSSWEASGSLGSRTARRAQVVCDLFPRGTRGERPTGTLRRRRETARPLPSCASRRTPSTYAPTRSSVEDVFGEPRGSAKFRIPISEFGICQIWLKQETRYILEERPATASNSHSTRTPARPVSRL